MNKGIIAYLVALVIIVIVVFFFFRGNGNSNKTTTITTTVAVNQSTTTLTNIPTTSSSTTTTINSTSFCISNSSTVNIPNGNFSTGTFAGWNSSGYGFGAVPYNLTYANDNIRYYNHTWIDYNGTFAATTFHGGLNLQQGNLTSNTFIANEQYLNFRVISPQSAELYVEILSNGKPSIVTYYNTYADPDDQYPTSEFVNASIPLTTLLCRSISIKVVAQVVGGVAVRQNYIAVGDFYLGKVPRSSPDIIVNQTIAG